MVVTVTADVAHSHPHPNLDMIAGRLGVSRMSVSRALRGEPGVKEEMRARIVSLAAELGYRPDPAVSRVMAELRRSRRPEYLETIALVQTHLDEVGAIFDGAREQAELLGYKLELFRPHAAGLTARGLSRMLHARGVRGVLLAPNSSSAHPRYWLDWPKFAVVLIGSSLVNQGLHRVQFDHYGAAVMALRKLRHAGYSRIGLVMNRGLHERAWHRQVAAYQAYVGLPAADRDRLTFFVEAEQDRPRFDEWLEAERPDALLCDSESRHEWVCASRVALARGIGVAAMNVFTGDGRVAGVRPHEDAIGREAMNVLATQLGANQLGLRPLPHTLFVPGTWHAGLSLRRGRGLSVPAVRAAS